MVRFPISNPAYNETANPKPMRNILYALSFEPSVSDILDHRAIRFGKPMINTAVNRWVAMPIFVYRILNVFFLRTYFEVTGVHASRIVAGMKHDEPIGNTSLLGHVGHSMSKLLFLKAKITDAHHAIPFIVSLGGPKPTILGLINLLPKSIVQNHAVSMGYSQVHVKEVYHR